MKLIGKLICWKMGHKRGKPVKPVKTTAQLRPGMFEGNVEFRYDPSKEKMFACPRCGRETRYKVKT